MTKQISVVDILKQSGKFNLVGIISNILSIPKSIIIAMVLAPKDYGIISFLGLWSTYAALINPGLLSASNRQMAHLIGNNNDSEAIRLQNISLTSDLLYSLLPFAVITAASLFFTDRTLKIGFLLTACTFAISHLAACWRGVNFVRQRFNLVAKSDLIQAVATTSAVIIFIYWLKIYAVLLAPIIGAFLAAQYYWKKGRINYRFSFDWIETKRLFKVGITFSSLALVYWGYQLIDRTTIASLLPLNVLGIYSYAAVYTSLGSIFLRDFGNVLAPVLWTKAGQAQHRAHIFYDSKRIIIYLALAAAIMIPFLQICFYFLTELVTRKFIDSIAIFIILSCNLYMIALLIIPALILQCSSVNKQALSLNSYIAGFILNVIFNLTAIRMGYGIKAIALINVSVQGLVTLINYYFVRGYIFENKQELLVFIKLAGIPCVLSVAFSFFHNYLIREVRSFWLVGVVSLFTQIVVWSCTIFLFYRKYFSRDKINKVIKECVNYCAALVKAKLHLNKLK
jgi:O-antigen/teichoic acid export membrane protein